MEHKRDWSIDLETLDTTYRSAIVSIGAVQFDRETGEIGIRHYVPIELNSAMKIGSVSASTLQWWMTQDKARKVFTEDGKTPLACALADLATLFRSKGDAVRVWGNGASFDITILERAFMRGAHGLAIPWHFTNIRDMRTVVDAAGLNLSEIPPVGTAHNALDDAEFQATAIAVAWRRIQIALGKTMPAWKGVPISGAKEISKASAPAPASTTPDEDDEL